MFLVYDPRRLEREVPRLEPAARQVPAISQNHPELVAAMVMERVDAVPPVERLALDRPDQAKLETRAHYRIADVEDERANRSRWRQLRPLLRTVVGNRSEEHTSELQSLMRISYSVFCLKKKKKKLT